jgi:hypothetical protein
MKQIKYRNGYKYQLVEEYSVEVSVRPAEQIDTDYIALSPAGLLTVKKSYAWDGPSGPSIDTKSFMRGSLVHDALYQLMRDGYLPALCREPADLELHRICREDGMSKLRAWYVLLGVRKFADFAAAPESRKPVLEAPYDTAAYGAVVPEADCSPAAT